MRWTRGSFLLDSLTLTRATSLHTAFAKSKAPVSRHSNEVAMAFGVILEVVEFQGRNSGAFALLQQSQAETPASPRGWREG